MTGIAALFRRPGLLTACVVLSSACAEAPPIPSDDIWDDDYVFPLADAGLLLDAGRQGGSDAGTTGPDPLPSTDAGQTNFDAGQDPASGDDAGQGAEDAGSLEPGDPDAGGTPDDGPDAGCVGASCGGSCVDTNTSAQHCGSCGHACPGGAACNQGVCAAPDNDCRYALHAGHDYLFCSEARNWESARNRCLDWGLDLAIVGDEAENTFLKGSEVQWLGLNDRGSEGQFRWVVPGDEDAESGAEPAFKNWAQGEPNNDERCTLGFICSREDCTELRVDGSWNDSQCGDTKAFVCESY